MDKLTPKDKLDLSFNFLGITASLIVGACSVIIFVYSNFLTRKEYERDQSLIINKLDRLDTKLDLLFDGKKDSRK